MDFTWYLGTVCLGVFVVERTITLFRCLLFGVGGTE